MFSQLTSPDYWLGVLYSLPAVLLALSFHEAAHAFAAYKCGDNTARNLGRMTLDPTKHLDPIGTICLILFRFGWAKPVPVNPRNFKHPRRDNIIVSLAGIITNFILSFVAYGILYGVVEGLHVQNEIFERIMSMIVYLNIALGIFNILPIPPLDGFQLFSSAFGPKSFKVISVLNRYGWIILIVLLITGIIGQVLGTFTSWLMGVYYSFFNLFG